MNKKSGTSKDAADKLVMGIKRKTRKGAARQMANQSRLGEWRCPLGGEKTAPLGESGGTIGLEVVSAGEAAFQVEMVRDGGVDRRRTSGDFACA